MTIPAHSVLKTKTISHPHPTSFPQIRCFRKYTDSASSWWCESVIITIGSSKLISGQRLTSPQAYLPVWKYISLFVCLSVWLAACLCLYVRLTLSLNVCMSICLHFFAGQIKDWQTNRHLCERTVERKVRQTDNETNKHAHRQICRNAYIQTCRKTYMQTDIQISRLSSINISNNNSNKNNNSKNNSTAGSCETRQIYRGYPLSLHNFHYKCITRKCLTLKIKVNVMPVQHPLWYHSVANTKFHKRNNM